VSALLLAPHADDETLFASYLILRHKPDVLVCSRSRDEEEATLREAELAEAMAILDAPYRVWPYTSLDRRTIIADLSAWLPKNDPTYRYSHVFAPAVEQGGHDEHNGVGQAALDVFGSERVTPYLTYAPRGQRSREGVEVIPADPSWIALKLRALACYRSQIEDPKTRPWFFELLDLREWVAVPEAVPPEPDPHLVSYVG
jgi:LmbE family N-acetylglucosaminyl deacetylase